MPTPSPTPSLKTVVVSAIRTFLTPYGTMGSIHAFKAWGDPADPWKLLWVCATYDWTDSGGGKTKAQTTGFYTLPDTAGGAYPGLVASSSNYLVFNDCATQGATYGSLIQLH